jgi:hypothetical protein
MSVFRCDITYKKIPGDSYGSTKNKLVSQGFLDNYSNIKDVAKFRLANTELSAIASAKLRREVRLFSEKKLLNGIRAVPDMKLFGMIDQLNKTPSRLEIPAEQGLNDEGDSDTNQLAPLSSKSVMQQIYEKLGKREGDFIEDFEIERITPLIERYNSLNTGKVLSLKAIPALGKNLISVKYKANYLYNAPIQQLNISEDETFTPTDSNNNFNLPCIR